MKQIKNLPLFIAIILIGVAGFGFFTIIQSIRNDVNVLVAKQDLSAYTFASKGDFDILAVPEAAVDQNVLTEADYDALFVSDGSDLGTVITYPFLQGQWIIEGGVSKDPQSTFAVVLPDERPAAVTSTVTGTGLGTIGPGDVVTATPVGDFGDGGGQVEYAKVLCITTLPTGCSNILPENRAGTPPIVQGGSENTAYYVILAVPAADAPNLTGRQVAMTLDPFCRVGSKGEFIGDECDPPGSRQASEVAE